MDASLWAKAHGATTHFPIALLVCSAGFDAAGFILAGRPCVRDLHGAGYWSIIVAALGAIGAAFSGLFLTRGSVWGHGALRLHHLFVWPAVGLLVALATWRVIVGRRMTRRMLGGYLAIAALATAVVSAAGYWGGELTLRSA
jgi:uncharacterized membrane protein